MSSPDLWEQRLKELEAEKRFLLRRIEGLKRDRDRYEHLIDGQRVLLRRISEEYRESEKQVASQQRELFDLADNLNRTIRELASADARLRQESLNRIEAESHLKKSDMRLLMRAETLVKANTLLRELPSKILQAQEDERKRVSRELHDSVVQSLGVIKLYLDTELLTLAEEQPDHDPQRLHRILEVTESALEESRRIMANLRPSVLDDHGLLSALNWLVTQHEKMSPEIDLEHQFLFDEQVLPDDVRIVVFRVVQELLVNLRKHSGATQAELRVFAQHDLLRFSYFDNGVGLPDSYESNGLGFISMTERINLRGGSIAIRPNPDRGVGILADLPIRG